VLAEEVLWRGVVARYLIERYGRALGIAYAAAIYALAHWATLNPVLLLAALGCGLYWGWLYTATNDNLVAPTISHLMWDVLLLFLFPVVRAK
jgi:membrane protease YdiL (CAAX protease family)